MQAHVLRDRKRGNGTAIGEALDWSLLSRYDKARGCMTSPVSVTAALMERGITLPAASVLQMMQWSGLVEEVKYTSSSDQARSSVFCG